MLDAIVNNKYLLTAISTLGGIAITVFTQQLLNRRGRFRYSVTHTRVGVSTDDAIFGSVKVTWNNNLIANLFLSTVDLVNESMRDYENVIVKTFSNDTDLLTERTEVVGTTHFLKWTDEFAKELEVTPGQQPTQAQVSLYRRERNYLIPTMNRGQAIRFTFLNAAKTQNQPTLWLDIVHKGVKLHYGIAHNKIFGVSQPTAGYVGLMIGIIFVGIVISLSHTVWISCVISLAYGLFAQIFGAITLKVWRWLQNLFGG
jgi:hypothetical protein